MLNTRYKTYAFSIANIAILAVMLIWPFNAFGNGCLNMYEMGLHPGLQSQPLSLPDSIAVTPAHERSIIEKEISVLGDSLTLVSVDTIAVADGQQYSALFSDSTLSCLPPPQSMKVFTPDPVKAVWLSALCPGLGQIYNRRYWKLPIVIGGFMGLAYGSSWNNGMLQDYTRAYSDIMDNDPTTNSYMDFFPANTEEASLNRQWLQRTLLSRKNYFRRNRDLCIICMVGVYLIAMVDAYVDASLTNFDISPDISMQLAPAVINNPLHRLPAVGLQWAINF